MRVLWIPHTRWTLRGAHRARYLVDCLMENHEIHVVTWSEPTASSVLSYASPATHLRALIPWRAREGRIGLHHIPRWCLQRVPLFWRQNQEFLRSAVRRIVREEDIEVIVFGSSAYLIGFPPRDTGIPVIFDYVDYACNKLLDRYLEHADAVICASNRLQKQVQSLGRDATYCPNGVDFERLNLADGSRVRKAYGIGNNVVISLIGLTASRDLYFVDSLLQVSEKIPEARFLFVGKGAIYDPLRKALRPLRRRCIWTGWIPPERVYDFFKASDVGLYPGADIEYFRSACPIKLLEYSACGTPSVSSPVAEIDHLDLRSVLQVDATATGFATGIINALGSKSPDDRGKIPSWGEVAERFQSVLSELVS